MKKLEIREIRTEQTYDLRHRILWPEKPFDYIKLANDPEGIHLGCFVEDKLASVISFFISEKEARFRKFATETNLQGRGYGSALLGEVISRCEKMGIQRLWCHSRESAAGFYEKFGMRVGSERFFKGDIPYVVMEKEFA